MIDIGLIVSITAFCLAGGLFTLLMIILFDDRRRNQIDMRVQELLDYSYERNPEDEDE